MSQALPPPGCCVTPCDEPLVENIPGAQGEPGADGADGTDGINAFTTVGANFIQPAVNSNVTVTLGNSEWASVGQEVFSESGGYYLVIARPTTTSLTIQNRGYDANAAPGATIPSGSRFGPAGEKGEPGANGSSASVPLTTKGDVLGYDSAPARIPIGTDGKVLAADAAQVLGVNYVTVQPNTATDNAVPRFDGAAGLPVPLQNSKLIVTDDGAAQASGSGGNARGARAVDLQVERADVAQVASGIESVISGGDSNKASGANATVGGGLTNTASGVESTVSGGDTGVASGANATVAGGEMNTASGAHSTVPGGFNNVASANFSTASGKDSIADLYGQQAFAAGGFDTGADAQSSQLVWRNNTTGNTATELFLDGATQRAVMRDSFSWVFVITMIARSDLGDTAAWQITGAINKSGGVPALVSAVNVTLIAADAASIAAGWGITGAVAVTADAANDSLKIAVTGAAATNIRWVAHARIVEVYWPI